jgi:RHS repeat-associated protein
MNILNGQSLVKAFVPLPGGALAEYGTLDVLYYHPDYLGSARLISTSARTIYSDTAYAPFGEPYAQSGTTDLSFTGMNQDTVANLYDFPAREYGIQGRWPSPDPAGLGAVDPTNPQSWNRYAYVTNGPLQTVDPTGLDEIKSIFSTDCVWFNCYGGGSVAGGNYGGDSSGFSQGISMTGPLWGIEANNEAKYVGWLQEWQAQAMAASGTGAYTIIVHCNELDLWDISCDPPSQAVLGSKTWYSPYYNSDWARLSLTSSGVVKVAGGLDDPRFIAEFYAASAGSALIDAAVSDIALVEGGQIFGTGFNGNFPAFNANDEFRVGWWYFSETGEYGFRITGDYLNNAKIFLWPPKWFPGGPF